MHVYLLLFLISLYGNVLVIFLFPTGILERLLFLWNFCYSFLPCRYAHKVRWSVSAMIIIMGSMKRQGKLLNVNEVGKGTGKRRKWEFRLICILFTIMFYTAPSEQRFIYSCVSTNVQLLDSCGCCIMCQSMFYSDNITNIKCSMNICCFPPCNANDVHRKAQHLQIHSGNPGNTRRPVKYKMLFCVIETTREKKWMHGWV